MLNKPAGLACHPTKKGPLSSLIGRVRLYLADAARPHLINRLDRETSGLTGWTPRRARSGRSLD